MGGSLDLFLKGYWQAQLGRVSDDIRHFGSVGDSVQLTTALSQFGCCHLQLGNQADAYIIYEFFKKSQESPSLSTKEWAAMTRFMALYSLFDGNMEAAIHYYNQSFEAYRLLAAREEEAMMLIESGRWLFSLIGDEEKLIYITSRIDGVTSTVFQQVPILDANSFWSYILHYFHNEINPHPLIEQFVSVYESLISNDQTNTSNELYTLLAKVNQYKHPILAAWANAIAGKTLKNSEYTEKAKPFFTTFKINFDTKEKIDHPVPIQTLSFTLFHQFTLKKDGQILLNLNDWKRKKAEELLIYLLIHPNLWVSKDIILDELYPDEDVKKAANRLYVHINSINKIFKNINHAPLISMKDGKVLLNTNIIEEIDIQVYLKLYSVGRHLWFTNQEEAIALFQKARNMYSSHLLDHLLYFPWLNQFRESLKEKQLELLQKLYSSIHDLPEKEKLLHEMLDCDPFNERAIMETIHFLQNQERRVEAQEFYKKKRLLFQSELGIDFNMDVLK